MVTAMSQGDRQLPGTVHVALHRVRGRVPLIEVPDDEDLLRFGGKADEIDGLQRGAGLKTLERWIRGSCSVHRSIPVLAYRSDQACGSSSPAAWCAA